MRKSVICNIGKKSKPFNTLVQTTMTISLSNRLLVRPGFRLTWKAKHPLK